MYSAYEFDASGAYDVTAGVSVSTPNPDFDRVGIQEDKHLVFEARGPMPAAVIQAWRKAFSFRPHIFHETLTERSAD